MMTSPLSLLANLGPPSYLVQVPLGQEHRYRLAATVFLSLAVVFFGVWAARSRAFRRGSDRALLFACAGSLAVSYSTAWVWRHDGAGLERGLAAIVAAEMPWLWVQFCILAYLATWAYLQKRDEPIAAGAVLEFGSSPWRTNVIAVLMVAATVVPIVLTGLNASLVPLMCVCWVLVFSAWCLLRLMAWFVGV